MWFSSFPCIPPQKKVSVFITPLSWHLFYDIFHNTSALITIASLHFILLTCWHAWPSGMRLWLEFCLFPQLCRISNGRLLTNVEFPGLQVQYSPDNGATWCDASNVTKPSSPKMIFRTRSVCAFSLSSSLLSALTSRQLSLLAAKKTHFIHFVFISLKISIGKPIQPPHHPAGPRRCHFRLCDNWRTTGHDAARSRWSYDWLSRSRWSSTSPLDGEDLSWTIKRVVLLRSEWPAFLFDPYGGF